ncbi:LysM peptidoglycan-binding domain-containing protein, partial [Undibacterium sp. RuRC25W]
MNKENDQSKVHIILLDALNAGISGLKVAVKIGNELIHEGVTDAQGKIGHVHAKLGDDIGIYVKRFLNDEMKLVKIIKAFSEEQIVKLYSPKVKREILLQKDKGTPGNYQRKTYQVKAGNTLASIAKENRTTTQALVRLNN